MKVFEFKKLIRQSQDKIKNSGIFIVVNDNKQEKLISKISYNSIFGSVTDSSQKKLLLIPNKRDQYLLNKEYIKKYVDNILSDRKLIPYTINWKHLLKWAMRKESYDDFEMVVYDKNSKKSFELSDMDKFYHELTDTIRFESYLKDFQVIKLMLETKH